MESESPTKPINRNKNYLTYKDLLANYLSEILTDDERGHYQQSLKNLEPLRKAAWSPNGDREEVDRDNRLYRNYYDKVVDFEKKHGIIDFCRKYWKEKNKKA